MATESAPLLSEVPTNTTPVTDARTRNLLTGVLLFTIGVTLVVFFCFLKLYAGRPIMVWAWEHWLPNLNQEYGKLVIPIAILLVWYHRKQIRSAVKEGSNWGLAFLAAGFALFLLGTRAQQPRITMLAIPCLIFGVVVFLWGRKVARALAFPIGFLVFMIPVGALQQTSFRLQFLITGAMNVLSPLIGIKLNTIGTTLSPVDNSWGFDIAEGCSGIRSLVAIIMLTAIYAHIFERVWWKKAVLLALSIFFAVVANVGRIFTIILIAKMGYPKLAGGIYHEYSGFISFPVALGAMLLCHKLLNLRSNKVDPSARTSTRTEPVTIKRLVFLQLVLLAGLSSAYLVPTQSQQPIGIILDLPESIGQWSGESQKVTQRELEELAADTTFARRLYSNAFGDQILVSIVLAGEDPDNSIHRPERCLPAQGWTVVDSRTVTITSPALPTRQLEVTRLHNQRKIEDEKGNAHTLYNLNYYWFVGYTAVTPSHIDRALMDIRDRVTKGYNQRWAYVTVASNITGGLVKFGRSEAATDQMIQSLIKELAPRIMRPSVLKKPTQPPEKTVALRAP